MAPSTPPRKREHTWVTPVSTRKSLRFAPRLDLPFITHPNLKHALDSIEGAAAPQFLLPTPLTVGTGRKARLQFAVKPSVKSRGLTARLLSMASEAPQTECPSPTTAQSPAQTPTHSPRQGLEHDVGSQPQCPSTPRISASVDEYSTPPPKPKIEQKAVFEPFADSPGDHVVCMSVDELHKIPQKKLHNPFLTLYTQEPRLVTSKVDYSTHLELVNHRTGEKKIEELTEEQRALRPRKLDFSLAEHVPVKLNYNITNKYIENSLGPKFSMDSSQAKNSAGFDIFSPP